VRHGRLHAGQAIEHLGEHGAQLAGAAALLVAELGAGRLRVGDATLQQRVVRAHPLDRAGEIMGALVHGRDEVGLRLELLLAPLLELLEGGLVLVGALEHAAQLHQDGREREGHADQGGGEG